MIYVYIVSIPSLRSLFSLFDGKGEHGRFVGSSEGAMKRISQHG